VFDVEQSAPPTNWLQSLSTVVFAQQQVLYVVFPTTSTRQVAELLHVSPLDAFVDALIVGLQHVPGPSNEQFSTPLLPLVHVDVYKGTSQFPTPGLQLTCALAALAKRSMAATPIIQFHRLMVLLLILRQPSIRKTS
jgi:hypothetical protein